ncbi:hypothetical protein LG198_04145 [Methylobacillus arboreus]|nr:hypothetical protein [Methylobacillus arboreus]
MSGIAKKLLRVIGKQSAKSWAEQNGLPVQTVHEWIKHNRMPRGANFQLLINATGIPKDWWTSDDDAIPEKSITLCVDSQTILHRTTIDKILLNGCAEACRTIYGTAFTNTPCTTQISYIADCYNALTAIIADQSSELKGWKHLGHDDFVHLIKISIKLGKLPGFRIA